jgi:hypothetical protein
MSWQTPLGRRRSKVTDLAEGTDARSDPELSTQVLHETHRRLSQNAIQANMNNVLFALALPKPS